MITGDTLVEWGFPHSPEFGLALAEAMKMEARGVAMNIIRDDIMEMVPAPKIGMNTHPAIYKEAIQTSTDHERENLAGVRRQMDALMSCPVVKRGAIMPDSCPAGSQVAMIPVGGAIEVDNAIIPAAHSADICCSMYATFFDSEVPDSEILDNVMTKSHFGAGGRGVAVKHPDLTTKSMQANQFLKGLRSKAVDHMGTQGDGNHFTYLGKIEIDDRLMDGLDETVLRHSRTNLEAYRGKTLRVLVTHHGSRGVGGALYGRGAKCATRHTEKLATGIPKACHWIPFDTDDGRDYWDALQFIAWWTKMNHQVIHGLCLPVSSYVTSFGNEHNFVWKRGDSFMHGKGATPSWSEEDGRKNIGIIPLNMSEPILLTTSTDNDDYLSFAPHGAGRNMSRTQFLEPFRGDDGEYDQVRLAAAVAEATDGIDARWFSGKPDLSETPGGYKNATAVKTQIETFGLANLIGEIQPIGCVMAGEQPPMPWQKNRKKKITEAV